MPHERKNTTPEIEAITGQTDNRTRQERQRDALQDLLARDNWSPDEARLILVGLDPEQSFSEREGHWWLPSAAAGQLDLKDKLEQDEIYDRLRRVDGVGITTGTPGDIIKRAFDAGIFIPWLQVALDDNKYQLPDDLRKHLKTEEHTAAEKRASFDRRNEATSARHHAMRTPCLEAARLTIYELKAKGYPRHRNGNINVSAVIREIFDAHPDWERSSKTIRNWIKKYKLLF